MLFYTQPVGFQHEVLQQLSHWQNYSKHHIRRSTQIHDELPNSLPASVMNCNCASRKEPAIGYGAVHVKLEEHP